MKTTLMLEMQKTVEKMGDRPALMTKKDQTWHPTSWKEYYQLVKTTARAFMTLGLEQGKAVSILGNNRLEWFVSDLAAIFAGAIPGGIYTTNSPEQCQYIAEHSEANIIVVENATQLAKIKKIRAHLPHLKAIVLMEGNDDDDQVIPWEELPAHAGGVTEEDLNQRIEAQSPDDCCTLIYTSGTTGNPKGVMLSHDNIIWTTRQVVTAINGGPDEQIVSYLPLSHIAEQVVSLHGPLLMGCTSWFAESLDLLGDNLREIRPTLFIAVPRVWEKIQAKMVTAGKQASLLKKKIVTWAKGIGLEAGYGLAVDKPQPRFWRIAQKLVYGKVRDRLGFDRCRLFITTAAPISMNTLEFFFSLGIPVTEVYGMSECTGPATLSLPEPFKFRIGWAGPAIPEGELSIAADGEVLMRGRHIFKGYFKNEAATSTTLDAEGWLHSGDVGHIDEKGFLKITDRKKELIITAGGENIPPQILEGKLKSISIVNQVAIIGDKRKFLSALITLDPTQIEDIANTIKSPAANMQEAANCPKFNAYLKEQIDRVNESLARVQTIKKFTLLPQEFSVEGGELTPTMKIKRRIIYEKYEKEIEAMYAG